jgi:hypothetical protein
LGKKPGQTIKVSFVKPLARYLSGQRFPYFHFGPVLQGRPIAVFRMDWPYGFFIFEHPPLKQDVQKFDQHVFPPKQANLGYSQKAKVKLT